MRYIKNPAFLQLIINIYIFSHMWHTLSMPASDTCSVKPPLTHACMCVCVCLYIYVCFVHRDLHAEKPSWETLHQSHHGSRVHCHRKEGSRLRLAQHSVCVCACVCVCVCVCVCTFLVFQQKVCVCVSISLWGVTSWFHCSNCKNLKRPSALFKWMKCVCTLAEADPTDTHTNSYSHMSPM